MTSRACYRTVSLDSSTRKRSACQTECSSSKRVALEAEQSSCSTGIETTPTRIVEQKTRRSVSEEIDVSVSLISILLIKFN